MAAITSYLSARRQTLHYKATSVTGLVSPHTEPDPYIIPSVEEMLDEVVEANWLAKLDLNCGYYQVPMDQESIAKTAFRTLGASMLLTECTLVCTMHPPLFNHTMPMHTLTTYWFILACGRNA